MLSHSQSYYSQKPSIWAMALENAVPIVSVGICTLIVFLHVRQYLRNRREGSDEDLSEEDSDSQHKKFNEKCCIRCCTPFNETLVKKIVCYSCKFFVCQNCATLDAQTRCWACKFCQNSLPVHPPPQVELYKGLKRRCRQFQSAKLLKSFYKARRDSDSENENDSGYVPSLSAGSSWECSLQQRKLPLDLTNLEEESSLDITALKVREHIEDIVEKYLEDTLDSAPLDNVYNHPEYERIFLKYHGALRELLVQLTSSLQMAISNQPLENDETPSTIHSSLQAMVKELTDEAMRLPKMAESDDYSLETSSDEDDIARQSYEAILATAIINKAIDSFQKGHQGSNYSCDLGSLDYEHFETNNNGCSLDADDDFSWARSFSSRRSPIEIKIEEQIEEVTTTIHGSDSESSDEFGEVRSSGEPKVTRRLMRKEEHVPELDSLYAGLGLADSHRVPFPELGVDIVAADYPHPEVGAEAINYGVLMSSVESWEENWLFKKKKKVAPFKNSLGTVLGDDPVAMLVPNPQKEVKVKVGERDIDELSDMSDRDSVSSLDGFQEDEDEDGHEVLHEGTNLVVLNEESNDEEEESLEVNVFNKTQGRPKVENGNMEENAISRTKIQELCEKPSRALGKLQLEPGYDKDYKHSEQLKVGYDVPVEKSVRIPIFVPIANRKNTNDGITIVLSPDVFNVIVGKVARIHCKVTTSKPTDVAWFFGCELLTNDEKHMMYSKGDEHHLDIYDTDGEDSGTYSCFAYDGGTRECWRDFKVVVKGQLKKYSAPLFLKNTENLSVEDGKAACFGCKVIGVPEPKVTWYKDGVELFPGGNISVEMKSQGDYILSLVSSSKADRGTYMVIASNKMGLVSSSATLEIGSGKKKHLMHQPKSISEDRQQDGFLRPAYSESYSNETSMGKVNGVFEVGGMTDSAYLDKDRELPEESLYDMSPLAGTIAEREMRKWQNPIQLAHNPYSPENISERLKRTNQLVAPDVSNVATVKGEGNGAVEEAVKLNGDQKEERLTRYGRDYYVVAGEKRKWPSLSGSQQSSTEIVPEVQHEAAAALKIVPVAHVPKATDGLEGNSLRTPISGKLNRRDLHWSLGAVDTSDKLLKYGSVDRNLRNLNRLAKKLVEPERRSSHDMGAGSVNVNEEYDGMVRAPSVQELAKMFSGVAVVHEEPRKVAINKPEVKVDTKGPLKVASPVPQPRTLSPNTPVANDRLLPLPTGALKSEMCSMTDDSLASEVHSLTARSLTREFREAAKRNLPHVANRNMSSTHSDSEGSSSISSPSLEKFSDDQDTPSPPPRRNSRRKANRAAVDTDSLASDENSTCSSGLDFSPSNYDNKSPPSPVPKPRRKMAKSIESRAAAWDRKVQSEADLDPCNAVRLFPCASTETEGQVTYL